MPAEQSVVRVVPADHDRDARLGKPTSPTATDPRSASRHDRDRVYYSLGFRRLAGVTQVFTPSNEGYLTHNRLTHSLKVAQVGRSIADVLMSRQENHSILEGLGGIDQDVVEAAGLAHDIGHPPFGHVGEKVLDRYAIGELDLDEGFEGNAQTFRIAVRLEPRSRHFTGDLTAATRASLAKYPWGRASTEPPESASAAEKLRWDKFSVYEDDRQAFDTARAAVPVPEEVQSLEAAVMDVADDITYALHDLEDFYGARLLDTSALCCDIEHAGVA
jgi:dGTPase